ncbi:MAG TPA: nickel-binding protein [Acidimicrobiia bacterium]|nr:nickel-binding protein [Acidimicrobiia bacterium]
MEDRVGDLLPRDLVLIHERATPRFRPPGVELVVVGLAGHHAFEVVLHFQKELGSQDRHGVSHLKYWVDEEARKIFCLAEGSEADAVNLSTRKHTASSSPPSTQVTEHE